MGFIFHFANFIYSINAGLSLHSGWDLTWVGSAISLVWSLMCTTLEACRWESGRLLLSWRWLCTVSLTQSVLSFEERDLKPFLIDHFPVFLKILKQKRIQVMIQNFKNKIIDQY